MDKIDGGSVFGKHKKDTNLIYSVTILNVKGVTGDEPRVKFQTEGIAVYAG